MSTRARPGPAQYLVMRPPRPDCRALAVLPATEPAAKPVKPTRPRRAESLDAALDAPFTGLVDRAPSQYPGYVIEGAVVVAGELLTPTGWATRQVNFWPPKASLKPSPVTLPALSSLNEYRRRPL